MGTRSVGYKARPRMKREDDFRERRAALLTAARRLSAEAGADGAPLVAPALAREIVTAVSADLSEAIAARTARAAETLEELVDTLIDAVLEACRPWGDAIMLMGSTLERMTDFEAWLRIVGSWVGAVETAIAGAQQRGLVGEDIDPALTALVLRDALDRTARSAIRFEFSAARATTGALMCAALRPTGAERGSPTG